MSRVGWIACVVAGAGLVAVSAAQDETIEDTGLGLSKTSVFEVPSPPAVGFDTTAPGERRAPEPAFAGEPPRIPHAIDDFGPITREDNPCLACHEGPAVSGAVTDPGDPTPIPASHFVDLRRAPDQTRDSVAGARYVCTACHVSLTTAQPLVGNRFGEPPPDATGGEGAPAPEPDAVE